MGLKWGCWQSSFLEAQGTGTSLPCPAFRGCLHSLVCGLPSLKPAMAGRVFFTPCHCDSYSAQAAMTEHHTGWLKPQTCVSLGRRGRKPESMVSTRLGCGEGSLPGLQTAALAPCPHVVEREDAHRESPTPVTSSRPHYLPKPSLRIPSRITLGVGLRDTSVGAGRTRHSFVRSRY